MPLSNLPPFFGTSTPPQRTLLLNLQLLYSCIIVHFGSDRHIAVLLNRVNGCSIIDLVYCRQISKRTRPVYASVIPKLFLFRNSFRTTVGSRVIRRVTIKRTVVVAFFFRVPGNDIIRFRVVAGACLRAHSTSRCDAKTVAETRAIAILCFLVRVKYFSR